VEELYRRLSRTCRDTVGDSHEIVLVNDGSRDGTLAALQALADRDPHVVVVNLSRNHGHQLALTAGLSVARGDLIFILDADLQDPPELLPEMLARIEDGADVVYGQRRERAGESAFKKLSAKAFYRLISRLSAVDIPVDTGDFRLMTRRVLEVLAAMPEQHRFVRGMVSWVGFRQEPLLYDRDPRFAGETKYPLRKMIGFASDALTGFSVVPLRLAFYLGLLGGLASVALLLYSLIAYMLDDTVTGWTSMMTVVLFVSSIQMIMLGILGEYVGRIFMQSKQRPLFVIESVRRQTDGEPAPHPHEAA
jgi:dolichol-phosphate mannosyltransferase